MANLRDLRLRMRAIKQTLQVTKAMNLISSSKLRKGRRMLADTEPYFTRIQKSMCDILSGMDGVHSQFLRKPDPATTSYTAIVVITSDKGLAGAYNANVFRLANEICAQVKNPVLILIGAIGNRYFAHTPRVILESFSFHSHIPTLENAGEIADYLISQFLWGMFNEVHIVYTHMHSAIKLQATDIQLLPLNTEIIQEELSAMGNQRRETVPFEFLPSKKAVFDRLVPQYIKGTIYGCLIECYVSEQNSRMTAMDEASKSAEDMLASLQITYNRTRQAGITQEISEIVGGSAVLRG
ncbi:MAG: ATP synthase F1 subunit gamma [Treponema sp.]|nr:ATP synthase F1 subunit gamma [Treponema sp.]